MMSESYSAASTANSNGIVSIRDFGAAGDGVTDDTLALKSALATGNNIYLPPGTYLVDSFSLTRSGQTLYGEGRNTGLKAKASVVNTLMYVKAQVVSVRDFQIDMTLAGTEAICLYVDEGSTAFEAKSLSISGGKPRISFYATGSDNINFEHCISSAARDCGFQFNRCKHHTISFSESYNVDKTHGFQDVSGLNAMFFRCKASACGIFGFSLYQNSIGGTISHCEAWNTHKEGINVEGVAHFGILDNVVYWTEDSALRSEDYGISVFGNAANSTDANHGIVSRNRVRRSGKSGIALAERVQYVTVSNNQIVDSNLIGESFAAGVLLYGDQCRNNTVGENTYYDTASHCPYGYAEGSGSSNNYATNNRWHGNNGAGFTKGLMNIQPGSMQALNYDGFTSYNPSATGIKGAISAYTANGSYAEFNKIIDFSITIKITAAGSASEGISISLPFPNSTVATICNGRDALTGKALTGVINSSATSVDVRFYDNGAPIAAGSLLMISGKYQKV
jgi:hypothetical protein